jgi:hypothetical protein
MAEPRIRTGGCACGQLTFKTTGEPKRVGLCHCMTCRKISGAPFNAFVIYPVDQVTITGETKTWSATPESERCFCATCGSQVFDRDRASDPKVDTNFGINPMLSSSSGASSDAENRNHFSARCDSDEIEIKLGAFDEPNLFTPPTRPGPSAAKPGSAPRISRAFPRTGAR